MKINEIITEASSNAQQAAIAIAMKKAGKKPKSEGVAEELDEAGNRAGALNTAQQLYKAIQSSKGKPQHEIDLLQRQLNALARKYQLKPEEYTAGANQQSQQQAGGQQQRQQPPPPPPGGQQGNGWQQQYEKHYGQNAQQQQQANPDNIWNPQWAAKQQAAYRQANPPQTPPNPNGFPNPGDPNWAAKHMAASANMMQANQADLNKAMQAQMATGPWNMPGAKMAAEEEMEEGWQDFNKVEPYAVCLAGKPVKKFDYYEEARRFHDNWKQKLYREGNKEKADKITLMPLNLDEATNRHFGPKGAGTELARQIRANGDLEKFQKERNTPIKTSAEYVNRRANAKPGEPIPPPFGTKIQVKKNKGVAEELDEEFDIIENIIEDIAGRNGVDAEAIWEDLESLSDDELYVFAVTTPVMEDWQKANQKDRTDGMSQKAVNAYRRENPGSKLKTAVTTKPSKLKKGSKASKRRKSYCSRSRGQMKMHSISCAKTPDKAICKARRRWNC